MDKKAFPSLPLEISDISSGPPNIFHTPNHSFLKVGRKKSLLLEKYFATFFGENAFMGSQSTFPK